MKPNWKEQIFKEISTILVLKIIIYNKLQFKCVSQSMQCLGNRLLHKEETDFVETERETEVWPRSDSAL